MTLIKNNQLKMIEIITLRKKHENLKTSYQKIMGKGIFLSKITIYKSNQYEHISLKKYNKY